MQRRRTAFFKDVADARRVLVLGEATAGSWKAGEGRTRWRKSDYVDLAGACWNWHERAQAPAVSLSSPMPLDIALLSAAMTDRHALHFWIVSMNGAARLVERVALAACPNARWFGVGIPGGRGGRRPLLAACTFSFGSQPG